MGNREVIIEPKTEKATRTIVLQCKRVVHPVGKTIPEVQKAYLAGFIDGDGAIMALIERHPAKRVRVSRSNLGQGNSAASV